MRALAFALPLLRLRRPRLAALVTRRQLSSGFDGDRVNAPWTRDEDWRLWQARDEDLDAVAARFGRKVGGVAARLAKLEDPTSSTSRRLWGDDDDGDDGSEAPSDDGDFLRLGDDDLLRQCRVDFRRDSGPGGQKRNKVESACRITHEPTGVVANAADERSQHRNKAIAVKRLRRAIAHDVRRTTPDVAEPAESLDPHLAGILPWTKGERVGAKSEHRARAEQLLLDVVFAAEGSLSIAAAHLGGTTGQLSKLLVKDDDLFTAANKIRQRCSLAPLKRKR